MSRLGDNCEQQSSQFDQRKKILSDTWKTPCCPDNILDRLASMSLNPKVEQLVSGTLKESHNITVKEMKTIIKEKIRMLK